MELPSPTLTPSPPKFTNLNDDGSYEGTPHLPPSVARQIEKNDTVLSPQFPISTNLIRRDSITKPPRGAFSVAFTEEITPPRPGTWSSADVSFDSPPAPTLLSPLSTLKNTSDEDKEDKNKSHQDPSPRKSPQSRHSKGKEERRNGLKRPMIRPQMIRPRSPSPPRAVTPPMRRLHQMTSVESTGDLHPFEDEERDGERWGGYDQIEDRPRQVKISRLPPTVYEYEAFPWNSLEDEDFYFQEDASSLEKELHNLAFPNSSDEDEDVSSRKNCIVADPHVLFIPLIANRRHNINNILLSQNLATENLRPLRWDSSEMGEEMSSSCGRADASDEHSRGLSFTLSTLDLNANAVPPASSDLDSVGGDVTRRHGDTPKQPNSFSAAFAFHPSCLYEDSSEEEEVEDILEIKMTDDPPLLPPMSPASSFDSSVRSSGSLRRRSSDAAIELPRVREASAAGDLLLPYLDKEEFREFRLKMEAEKQLMTANVTPVSDQSTSESVQHNLSSFSSSHTTAKHPSSISLM